MDLLAVHTYDGKCNPDTILVVRRIAALESTVVFDVAAAEVHARIEVDGVDPPIEIGNIAPAIAAYRDLHPIDDVNGGVDVRDAFRVAWSWCRNDRDLCQLFLLNLDDMIRTNGTCQQGRSTRMLQLVAALCVE